MNLVKCYIENFGKLSSFSYEFSKGMNVICEENSWGKSTFAAFIKVMFYGFANDISSNRKSERIHYKPWQGGVYGGNLTFENDGKLYTIYRQFGKSKGEDLFEVYDDITHLKTNEYTKNIGIELFGLDRDSFEKSVFISQSDCENTGTSMISAKVSNLAENVNDMGNFELAKIKLSEAIKELKPPRSEGKLDRQESYIHMIENKIVQIKSLEKEALEIEKQLMVLKEKKENCINRENAESKSELYKEILDEYEERRNKLLEVSDMFGTQIPTKQELEICQNEYEEMLLAEGAMEIYEFDKASREEFERLNNIFSKEQKQSDKDTKAEARKINAKYIWSILLILPVLGIVAFAAYKKLGIVGAGISIGIICLFILAAFILRLKEQRMEKWQNEMNMNAILEDEKRYQKFKEQYVEYVKAKEEKKKHLDNVKDFFEKRNLSMEADVKKQLSDLLMGLQKYENCVEEFATASVKRENFEKKYDIKALEKFQIKEHNIPLEEILEKIQRLNVRLEEINSMLDEFSEYQNDIKILKEEYERDLKKYELLKKTDEFLSRSKHSFIAKYTTPLKKGFDKYYKMIMEKEAIEYSVDANVNITYRELGVQRELKNLSSGYKDLVGICIRMALIEAMYRDERPFIVLDDPFSNIDTKKLKKALELLNNISDEYQVIYFTCHNSRI